MIELVLLILSYALKKVLGLIFLVYGSFMASCKWELKAYWKRVAIANDKQLNVVGKYALNQSLSEIGVFGNELQTVSTGMYLARLHKFGWFWYRVVDKLDPDHFKKSFENHKKQIETEYINTKYL